MNQSIALKQITALKPQFSAKRLESDKVLITSEDRNCLLRGKLYIDLIPLLNDSFCESEIVQKLSDRYQQTHIYYALAQLEKQGLLETLEERSRLSEAAFWNSLGLPAQSASDCQFSVAIKKMDQVSDAADELSKAFKTIEIETVSESNADLIVYLVDDYLNADLASWNAEARQSGKPWLIARVEGLTVWVGPFFQSEQAGCWSCVAQRIKANRGDFGEPDAEDGQKLLQRPAASLPTTRALGLNLVATEIAKWVRNAHDHRLNNHVLTLDLVSLTQRLHPVVAIPHCVVCGDAPNSDRWAWTEETVSVQLVSREKTYMQDGGQRTCHPKLTVQKLQKFISPISGLYPDLQRAEVADQIYVYHIPEFGPAVDTFKTYRLSAAGKGASEHQAMASCLAEAMERYSCIYRVTDRKKTARWSELKDRAVHPRQLLQYSDKQFEKIKEEQPVKLAPFDESVEINWTPVWSLTNKCVRYLPTGYCYFSFPYETQTPYLRIDSNGCASGNNLEEATVQAFLELIERDALSMFWHNRVQRPAIDLSSFNDRFFDEMVAAYAKMDRKLVAINITNDIGVPVVVAATWRKDGTGMLFGAGAHLDARMATSRAVSELNQMMPLDEMSSEALQKAFNPSLKGRPHRKDLLKWLTTETIETQPFVMPDNSKPHLAADLPRSQNPDLLQDIEGCRKAVEALGMEVLLLDITRPDFEFSVARVTVPGLRNLHGLAPGRLYDVPVKLGWLDKPHTEDELNPYPFLW